MIEKVGWDAGNKLAKPVFLRNPDDGGTIIVNGEPVLDCDFPTALHRIRNSDATVAFDWLSDVSTPQSDDSGWTISSTTIYQDEVLTLDPKRQSKKYCTLRKQLSTLPHKKLHELVDFIPEKHTSQGNKTNVVKSNQYGYIELSNMGQGEYQAGYYKGWELPDRAKHFAEPRDIYFGSIWGSAIKWCIIADDAKDLVVTNGCLRCRMKPGEEQYLTDLLAYMNSEGWGVQMRAIARGSDGLAEISASDAADTIIPLLDSDNRANLQQYVDNLISGHSSLYTTVGDLIDDGLYNDPSKRPNHMTLV